jgi:hypothetical protein
MRNLMTLITLGALASTSVAQSQLEFGATGVVGSSLQQPVTRVAYRAVFDTTLPPDDTSGADIVYNAVSAEILDQTQAISGFTVTGSTDVTDGDLWIIEGVSASLRILPDGSYTVEVSAGSSMASLNHLAVAGPLTDPDMSLNDDPEAFKLELAPIIASTLTIPTGEVLKESGGFVGGGFVSWIIPYTAPEPECAADVNGDGELDFFDVSAFLQLFGMGCP